MAKNPFSKPVKLKYCSPVGSRLTCHKKLFLRPFVHGSRLTWYSRFSNNYYKKIATNQRLLLNLGNIWTAERIQFSQGDSNVPELNEGNFSDYLERHGKVFVMFYEPSCPLCQRSWPQFEQLYEEMKEDMGFGVVDSSQNETLAKRENIEAFPTFKLYTCKGSCQSKSHIGQMNLDGMRSFVNFSILSYDFSSKKTISFPKSVSEMISFLREKLSKIGLLSFTHRRGKNSSYCMKHTQESRTKGAQLLNPHLLAYPSSESLHRYFSLSTSNQSIRDVSRTIKIGKHKFVFGPHILELDDSNFDPKLKPFESALVYFYSTWCPECGHSLGQYLKAAQIIEDSVGVLAICNVENSLQFADKYYVGKLPTLKYFRRGRYITDYVGDIKVELLVKFMKDPHIDEDFLLQVTKHKPKGDCAKNNCDSKILTPTQKNKMWEGKDGSEMIIEVTNENFDKVLKDNNSFLLLFYACWSRMCVGLKHDYIDVAKGVEKTDVALGACDCEENAEVADRFLVGRFPTIKYFKDGRHVRDYTGDFHAESILKFLKESPTLQITPSREKRDESVIPQYWDGIPGADKILHLTDSNFREIIKKNKSVLLMIYTSWCIACKPVRREFGRIVVKLDPELGVLAAADAESNNELAEAFFVTKFPTIKYIKDGEFVADYIGQRRANDFLSYMKNPPANSNFSQLSSKRNK